MDRGGRYRRSAGRALDRGHRPRGPPRSARRTEDQVLAKGGDDTVFGLGGEDRIDGGPGNDRLQGDGTCPANAIRPTDCSDGDDRSGDEDVLRGGDGDDILLGGRGNDLLDGGAGIDSLSGDAGNDEIDAGADDDEVDGGTGLDTIDGRRRRRLDRDRPGLRPHRRPARATT